RPCDRAADHREPWRPHLGRESLPPHRKSQKRALRRRIAADALCAMNGMPAALKSRGLVHATAGQLARAKRPCGGYTDGAVLLLGPSGTGKSDVALRLIAAGAELISDDQTVLFLEQGILFADAPPGIAGTMEIRGVGILRMKSTGKTPVILA